MQPLLVVTGEPSGDAFAAPVVERLRVRSFGLGGPHLREAGMDVVLNVADLSAMGLAATRRAPALASALPRLVARVMRERPRAALLVGFSDVNAVVARALTAVGTRVLWYAPPQVWAWRRGRAPKIARSAERLATILPFEAPFWRVSGATAEYVGHPVLEVIGDVPPTATEAGRVAILPGSRGQEVRALLVPMLEAARALTRSGEPPGTVIVARGLDSATRAFVKRRAAEEGLGLTEEPIARALSGHDVALACSGTATLECAALAVPPVIVYRTDPVTHAIARRLVQVPHVGLPNLVLGRAAFPELVQERATSAAMVAAVRAIRQDPSPFQAACRAVRHALSQGTDGRSPSERVAAALSPWLA